MTYSEVDRERVSGGSFETVFYTVNITSLDNADNENLTLASDLNLDRLLGVAVAGAENADLYTFEYDHLEDDLYVNAVGGTDPGAATDVGEVRLRVDGDPGA